MEAAAFIALLKSIVIRERTDFWRPRLRETSPLQPQAEAKHFIIIIFPMNLCFQFLQIKSQPQSHRFPVSGEVVKVYLEGWGFPPPSVSTGFHWGPVCRADGPMDLGNLSSLASERLSHQATTIQVTGHTVAGSHAGGARPPFPGQAEDYKLSRTLVGGDCFQSRLTQSASCPVLSHRGTRVNWRKKVNHSLQDRDPKVEACARAALVRAGGRGRETV